jgi:hypothetical protein
VAVAAQLAEDDELAAAFACHRLRQAVAGTERRAAGARLSTTIGSAFCSMGKLEWAVVSCWLPLSGRLLLRAARSGQLKLLSWLRARGCAWEPCKGDGKDSCSSAAAGGSTRAAVGARGWMPLGQVHVLRGRCEGPSARALVGSWQRLPVG